MKPRSAGAVLIFFVALILVLRAARVVPAGHVGVVDLFGNVRAETLPSGLHLVNPLARVHRMSVQTNEVKETMDTPSSEGLIVHLDVSVLYHLDATKAPEVYRSIGLNYESVLVTPNVRSAVREVTSSYEAKALYSPEREKMSSEINQHVHDAIEPRGVAIERLLLRDVALAGATAAGDSGKIERRTRGLENAIRFAQRKTGGGAQENRSGRHFQFSKNRD